MRPFIPIIQMSWYFSFNAHHKNDEKIPFISKMYVWKIKYLI